MTAASFWKQVKMGNHLSVGYGRHVPTKLDMGLSDVGLRIS